MAQLHADNLDEASISHLGEKKKKSNSLKPWSIKFQVNAKHRKAYRDRKIKQYSI